MGILAPQQKLATDKRSSTQPRPLSFSLFLFFFSFLLAVLLLLPCFIDLIFSMLLLHFESQFFRCLYLYLFLSVVKSKNQNIIKKKLDSWWLIQT